MKTIFCLVILLAVTFLNSSAQVTEGAILVGGSLNLNISNSKTEVNGTTTEGPKITDLTVLPKAGYFFTENWGAGLFLGVTSSSTKEKDVFISGDKLTEKTTLFNVGPWARYYIYHGEITHFFFEGSIGFGFGKAKSEYFEPLDNTTTIDEANVNSFSAGITPGASFNICTNSVIEFYVGFLGYNSYSTSSTENGEEISTSSSSFGFDWNNVGTGIIFFF